MADALSGIDVTTNYYKDMQIESAVQRASSTTESTLGMDDFIKLLVAQLQNQDMLNPMDNTEFISQMATFSTLTAINSMAEQSTTSYAVSLLGKNVTAAAFNSQGVLERTDGIVTGVSLFEGKPKIYIGDKVYDLQSVMTVGTLPDAVKADDTDGEESNYTPGGDDYSTPPLPNAAGNGIKPDKPDEDGNNTYVELDQNGDYAGLWTWNGLDKKWVFAAMDTTDD